MSQLHGILQLPGTVVNDFTLPPNEDGPKAVLVLRAPARPAVISALGLEHLFHEGALLRQLSDRTSVSIELFDQMLSLPSSAGAFDNYYPERIYKFKLIRPGAVSGDDDEGDRPAAILEFRVHIRTPRDDSAKIRDLVDFHLRHLKAPFECALQPRQGSLFGGGRRVDMAPPARPDSEDDDAAAASAAEQQPPPERPAEDEPIVPGPPLASMGEMNRRYGAGARRKKQQQPPPQQPDQPEPPTIQ